MAKTKTITIKKVQRAIKKGSKKQADTSSGYGCLAAFVVLVFVVFGGLLASGFSVQNNLNQSHTKTAVYRQSHTDVPRPTATPRPATAVPRPNNSSSTTRRPDNCADARAMGLTAQQAGQWSHLDRDGDGVACYGD